MKKLLGCILLLFASSSAWADSWVHGFTNTDALVNHTDLSVDFLAQIFGTVGNTLDGSTGQMLGHLFYKFNEGIIVIAGLYLVYTVFTIALRGANDGSFMGANRNVAFAFLKIALGFSMLVPNSTTGYSVLQNVVMSVVVQGVGLADQTWNYSLDYINNGGAVWRAPGSTQTDDDVVLSDGDVTAISGTADKNTSGLMQHLFAMDVCMVASQADAQQNGTSSKMSFSPIEDDTNFRMIIPGQGNTSTDPASYSLSRNGGSLGGLQKAYCGEVYWDYLDSTCSADSDDGQAKCDIAKNAVTQAIYDMQPAAQQYYCSKNGNKDYCNGISVDGSSMQMTNRSAFFGGLVAYSNTITPLAQMFSGSNKTDSNGQVIKDDHGNPIADPDGDTGAGREFIDDAQSGGWMLAGRYYWSLARVSDYYAKIKSLGTYTPTTTNSSVFDNYADNTTGHSDNPGDVAKAGLDDSKAYYNNSTTSPVYPGVHSLQTQLNSGASSKDGLTVKAYNNYGLYWFLEDAFEAVVNPIKGIYKIFQSPEATSADPVVFLQSVGQACLDAVSKGYFQLFGIFATVAFAAAACRGLGSGIGDAAMSLMSWMKAMVMPIIALLIVSGVILTIYLPLYPYLLYTFGIISWFIAVIEAMVAAPLVCFGLTHPEGHDFLGEAKQAMMLLLGVFLRPVLMVIGLIASMILSYVAYKVVIFTFSSIMGDISATAGVTMGGTIDPATSLHKPSVMHVLFGGFALGKLFKINPAPIMQDLVIVPCIVSVFTGVIYVVTTQCYSLIYMLPDYILRWIGGPTNPSQAAEMAGKVLGIANSSGNASGKAAGETLVGGESLAKGTGEMTGTAISAAAGGGGGGGGGEASGASGAGGGASGAGGGAGGGGGGGAAMPPVA